MINVVEASAVPLNLTPSIGIAMLEHIEFMARLSHRSEEKMSHDSYLRFIKAVVMDHGDWSVTEHASVSVLFTLDRATAAQLMRHRIAAYTMESQRFVNYTKQQGLEFIYPVIDDRFDTLKRKVQWHRWYSNIQSCVDTYKELLELGWRPEEARSVLPMCTAAKVGVTMNLRSWRHVFMMRTTMEAQSMIRSVTESLLKQFQENIPILFDDIIPGKRQSDNFALGR